MSDETIGYKKPPTAYRFAPGRSGNPSGRPRGARSFTSDLRDELGELTSYQEGDRDIEVSKQRLLVKRLVGSAIKGDARAMATLVAICVRASEEDDASESAEDREIVETFARRNSKQRKHTAASINPPGKQE